MLLLRTEKLPDGPHWLHELMLDGYREGPTLSGVSAVSLDSSYQLGDDAAY